MNSKKLRTADRGLLISNIPKSHFLNIQYFCNGKLNPNETIKSINNLLIL